MAAALVAALLYALHQDFWFWREARPLVFGFLPIGLFYHAAYTVAISALMLGLVRSYWPAHLDVEGSTTNDSRPTTNDSRGRSPG
jgi:hypothetical protein